MTATEHIQSLTRDPGRFRVAVVLGTRPEAIKLAPIVHALEAWPELFEPVVIATSQQREMLAQAMAAMRIRPDIDLGLTHANRTLAEFTAHAMLGVTNALMDVRPGILLVQGDTSTVAAAALSAFYQNIPVGHVEAGLRSGDMHRPFPEEANRRIAAIAADLHFAPTERARHNLLSEGTPEEDVYVTGNTVVDALASMPRRGHFDDPALEAVNWTGRRVVLVTVHRRESLGDHLHDLCRAFMRLVHERPEVHLVFPVHLNPRVREVVFAELRDHDRITLLDPLSYPDLLEVMRRSHFVMSDSGGIQEETPSLRKPILILRTVTERPEVVDSGFGRLVGTDPNVVVGAANQLLRDDALYRRMVSGNNPFGDGTAATRIVRIIVERFGLVLPERLYGSGAA
jgi:UDP-N-acetylglucosamine 2-epimerase (non-hydrolysing)